MNTHVRCLNCDWQGYLKLEKKKCPKCKIEGWLALWYNFKRFKNRKVKNEDNR
jgi:RecJ-like exonuclease